MSETSKYREVTVPFCNGNGVDIGSGGDPVVPSAIQVELPPERYAWYNSGHLPAIQPQWRGTGESLPFKNETLDYVYSSHLLEDFFDWSPILGEWVRVLRPGGHLIILVPDKTRWNQALQRGQPPNCEHRHESYPGELSTYARQLGIEVIIDRLAKPDDTLDYTVIFVGKKLG